MAEFTDERKEFSRPRLIVCLHGVNAAPSQFKEVVDQLRNRPNQAESDLFVPYVLEKGNAPLDALADQTLRVIRAWAERRPRGELVLIGTSNGARIAQAVDARLDGALNLRKITVLSIAGACRGSSTANLAKKVSKFLPVFLFASQNILEEMPIGSARNQRLEREWQEKLRERPPVEREYTFIASSNDCTVPDRSSTLMKVPDGIRAQYGIACGEGHSSIVAATAQLISEIAIP